MILSTIHSYQQIIANYDILKFEIVGNSYCLIYRVDFVNTTTLFAKDYLFLDGSRKYSFHWQDAQGNCIIRWDNAPHHQSVITFPYHQHIGPQELIEESPPMNLEQVLNYIQRLAFLKP